MCGKRSFSKGEGDIGGEGEVCGDCLRLCACREGVWLREDRVVEGGRPDPPVGSTECPQ